MKVARIKIHNKGIGYILFTLIVVFSDILGNGNLNLFYFMGSVLFFVMARKKEYWKDIMICFIPFILIPIAFFFVYIGSFQLIRVLVYTIKIFLDVTLYSYFKHNISKFKSFREINTICKFFLVELVISLAFLKVDFLGLWRHNDIYNSVSKTRLQFIYSEPSVLGLLCCILLIILIFYALYYGIDRIVIYDIGILFAVMILTFSISAIGYLALSTAFLVLCLIFRNKIKNKAAICIYLLFAIVFLVLLSDNPINNRLAVILAGNDVSYNYRANMAYYSLIDIMNKTKYWGLGLSNMNTAYGLDMLSSTGIDGIYANSFMYFIAENGVIGIIYIVWLLLVCITNIIRIKNQNKRVLSIALAVIWFGSQIAGGYFTDPILWILFGIICSKSDLDLNHKSNNREIKQALAMIK